MLALYNEEVLCRLFLLTFIYFILSRLITKRESYIVWSAIIITALLFGVGHLPAAFKLVTPSVFEVTRILLLNGIAGITFGYLYCTQGFWSAVIAHGAADIVIHALFIL
jgi:membrane protease YdiL (CAAX protease family)